MAKIHDKFVIELAEVIKGYGNDPDVDDPFRLSEFYRFYELPEIAVSENHFKTMIPLEVVEKSAQPGWIPWDSGGFPEESGTYTVTVYDGVTNRVTYAKYQKRLKRWELTGARAYWRVLAWMEKPKPWEGGQDENN